MLIYFSAIYSCDEKAEFLASLLQSSVSQDPSEIILLLKHVLLLMSKTAVLLNILCKPWHIFQGSLNIERSKEKHLFEHYKCLSLLLVGAFIAF